MVLLPYMLNIIGNLYNGSTTIINFVFPTSPPPSVYIIFPKSTLILWIFGRILPILCKLLKRNVKLYQMQTWWRVICLSNKSKTNTRECPFGLGEFWTIFFLVLILDYVDAKSLSNYSNHGKKQDAIIIQYYSLKINCIN